MSPILYNIYTRKIMEGIEDGVKRLQFADDIALYVTGGDSEAMRGEMKRAMRRIWKNLRSIGLELQMEKTEIVEFRGGGRGLMDERLTMEGENIKIKREAKFLGLTLDENLNFESQLQKMRERVIKAGNVLRWINGVSWGAEVATSLMLYKSLVRSKMEYALFLYFPDKGEGKMKVERLQYRNLRMVMGYRMSTPTYLLVEETKVLRMEERVGLLARRYCSKIIAEEDGRTYDVLDRLTRGEEMARLRNTAIKRSVLTEAWRRVRRERRGVLRGEVREVFRNDYWMMTERMNVDLEVGRGRGERDDGVSEIEREVKSKYMLEENCGVLWTDGSKREDGRAVGVAVYDGATGRMYRRSIDRRCSIFTAEAIAVGDAVEVAIEDRESRDYVVFTDSESVLKVLKGNRIDVDLNPYAYRIRRKWQEYKEVKGRERKIVFVWIPAHTGLEGNERADRGAKAATEEEEEGDMKMPVGDLRPLFEREMEERTGDCAREGGGYRGREYFERVWRENRRIPWFEGLTEERGFIVMINRLRVNHYNVKKNLREKGYVESAECRCGRGEESIDHVVFDCELYGGERGRMMEALRGVRASQPYGVMEWLGREEWTTMKVIYQFIRKTKGII